MPESIDTRPSSQVQPHELPASLREALRYLRQHPAARPCPGVSDLDLLIVLRGCLATAPPPCWPGPQVPTSPSSPRSSTTSRRGWPPDTPPSMARRPRAP